MGEGCHRALLARGAPRGRVGQRVGERERARADALAGAGVGAPYDCEGQRAGRAGGTRGMARAAAREYGGVRVSVAYVLFIAAIATAAFHMGVIAAGRRGTLEPRAAAEQALVARARPDIERRELSVTGAVRGARASRGPSSSGVGEGWATGGGGGVRVISWAPRASVWRGFLSDAEADTIVARARPLMERSRVVSETGEGVESKARTSRGAFLPRHNVSDIRKVEDRIAAWTSLPWYNGEAMQVLQYERGEEYTGHPDWFDDRTGGAPHLKNGGQRVATVLMYLSDVDAGGETVFDKADPAAEVNAYGNARQAAAEVAPLHASTCASKGLAVAPRKGDALLFWNVLPNGTADPLSVHAGCPVDGTRPKWTATKWIRAGRHSAEGDRPPSPCIDTESMCSSWARSGECEANPDFMLGVNGFDGACELSCNPQCAGKRARDPASGR